MQGVANKALIGTRQTPACAKTSAPFHHNHRTQSGAAMAKKKDRAFFICPRWKEVVNILRNRASGTTTLIPVHKRTAAAIVCAG
jgi:hypothetical protein